MNAREKIADAGQAFQTELTDAIERMRRQLDAQDFLLWAAKTAEDYAAGRCGMPVVSIPGDAPMAPQRPESTGMDEHEDFPRVLRTHNPPEMPEPGISGEEFRAEMEERLHQTPRATPSNEVDFAWADGAAERLVPRD